VKAIQRVGLIVGGQLPEAGLFQATVASEDLTLRADQGPGSDGSEFVVSIRLVKRAKRHLQAAQPVEALKKPALIGNTENDKVWMLRIRR
jgi:hypothetical protein